METRHEAKDLYFLERARNLLDDALMYVDSVSLRGHAYVLGDASIQLGQLRRLLFDLRKRIKKELA